jgi:hypothetical protein
MDVETKDFTPEQAINWIKAESEKLNKAGQISERLEQEGIWEVIMNNPSNRQHFPHIIKAHKDLIALLRAKLGKIEKLKAFTVIEGGKD